MLTPYIVRDFWKAFSFSIWSSSYRRFLSCGVIFCANKAIQKWYCFKSLECTWIIAISAVLWKASEFLCQSSLSKSLKVVVLQVYKIYQQSDKDTAPSPSTITRKVTENSAAITQWDVLLHLISISTPTEIVVNMSYNSNVGWFSSTNVNYCRWHTFHFWYIHGLAFIPSSSEQWIMWDYHILLLLFRLLLSWCSGLKSFWALTRESLEVVLHFNIM